MSEAKAKDDKLLAPAVGEWRPLIADGEMIGGGSRIGLLNRLGETTVIRCPKRSAGIASDVAKSGPIDYGQALLTLETIAAGENATKTAAADSSHLELRAEFSGRYYARANPEADPFVSVGDTLEKGQTVCLIEVMKTFTKVTYEGDDLPDRAKVIEIVATDQSDVEAGEALFRLEPA